MITVEVEELKIPAFDIGDIVVVCDDFSDSIYMVTTLDNYIYLQCASGNSYAFKSRTMDEFTETFMKKFGDDKFIHFPHNLYKLKLVQKVR